MDNIHNIIIRAILCIICWLTFLLPAVLVRTRHVPIHLNTSSPLGSPACSIALVFHHTPR